MAGRLCGCKAKYKIHYNRCDTVAIKTGRHADLEGLKEEMQKLMRLRNDYVLQFWGYSWMKVDGHQTLLLITEFMDLGSLCAPSLLCCSLINANFWHM